MDETVQSVHACGEDIDILKSFTYLDSVHIKEYKGEPSSSRSNGSFKAAWLLLLTIYREERQDSTIGGGGGEEERGERGGGGVGGGRENK